MAVPPESLEQGFAPAWRATEQVSEQIFTDAAEQWAMPALCSALVKLSPHALRYSMGEPDGLWFTAMLLVSLFVVAVGYYVSIWLAVALWAVLLIVLIALRPQ